QHPVRAPCQAVPKSHVSPWLPPSSTTRSKLVLSSQSIGRVKLLHASALAHSTQSLVFARLATAALRFQLAQSPQCVHPSPSLSL
ncbi:hypothetical protein COCVIDRAFT_92183, partial [Bipolaris victoriae FI3]